MRNAQVNLLVEIPTTSPNNQTDNSFWNSYKDDLRGGSWAVLIFLLIVGTWLYKVFGKALSEAVERHLQLMETLTEVSKTNAETMKNNAKSLERLSKTNSKVAAIMATDMNIQSKKVSIMTTLAKAPDVEDDEE